MAVEAGTGSGTPTDTSFQDAETARMLQIQKDAQAASQAEADSAAAAIVTGEAKDAASVKELSMLAAGWVKNADGTWTFPSTGKTVDSTGTYYIDTAGTGTTGTGATGSTTTTTTTTAPQTTAPTVALQPIPAGAVLYRVTDPASGDINYYAVYQFNGIGMSFRIGTDADMKELFPDPNSIFSQTINVSQGQYDASGVLDVGNIDEMLGQTEDFGTQMRASLRTYGMESIPDWIRNDTKALTIAMTGALEDWSQGRILNELSGTVGFKERFPAWDWAMSQNGGDTTAAMTFYTQSENRLTKILQTYRGPQADLSPAYLGEIMQLGWTAEAVAPILAAEQSLKADPAILEDLNRMLIASGQQALGSVGAIALIAAGQMAPEQAKAMLGEVDFTQLLGGNNPSDVFDIINDAMTLSALEDQGFVGLDIGFVRALRNETGGMLTSESVKNFAQTAAINVLRFGREIDRSRYGLTEESLIAAVAGRPDPQGRSSAQIAEIMNRVVRERQAASGGFESYTSGISRAGSLQLKGLQGL